MECETQQKFLLILNRFSAQIHQQYIIWSYLIYSSKQINHLISNVNSYICPCQYIQEKARNSQQLKNLLHILLKTFQKMKKRKTDRYPLNPEAGEKDKKWTN